SFIAVIARMRPELNRDKTMPCEQGSPSFERIYAKAVFCVHGAVEVPLGPEACGSTHRLAREMEALGHEVKLIAPQYARPFVKRRKIDAADAEAIVIAARQPEMRFVSPKAVEQQPRAAMFRDRERLVHQRTGDVNALRALLYEHGYVFPSGIG
ncbi:MAG: hypothetical protein Q4P24_14125, partial [Rhodobacterales bacterium]|nr:hypothetical protein [Rhodobacterales bacterium]